MRSDRLAGAALIAGSIGFVLTMAVHPTGGGHQKIIREAALTIGVHILAIVAVCVQAFGLLRLTVAVRPARPYADAAFVAFAFAAVFAALAATVSGILGPALAQRAVGADPEELPAWHVVFTYNFRLNAALTQVFIGAAAAAMLTWSLAMFRIATRWNYVAGAGVALGALSLLALLTGQIRNTVHHVGLFVLCFAAWSIAVGALMCLPPVPIRGPNCN